MPYAANPAPRPLPRSFIRQRDLIILLPSPRFPSRFIKPTRPHPLVSLGSLYLLYPSIIVVCLIPSCKNPVSPFTGHLHKTNPLLAEQSCLNTGYIYPAPDKPC